jgi:hypothetical protein
MAAAGVNAVRVYTAPPRRVLDAAARAGLWVLVGLPWEQHVAFLSADAGRGPSSSASARTSPPARAIPAVLGYAVGNEIPASIVRWHGRRRVESFLERLCAAARSADPGALLTYVNFPSTEFLRLPFVDVLAFNVYLEDPDRLAAYLARLQNLAGERPLLLAEVGLDSARNGEDEQAAALARQLDVARRGGCAGAFVFAWTDAWHRGEDEVLDWDFGLVGRCRRPKPALRAVARAFATPPLASWTTRPRCPSWSAPTTARPRCVTASTACSRSTTRAWRRSSSTTAPRTRARRSPGSSACAPSPRRTGASAPPGPPA